MGVIFNQSGKMRIRNLFVSRMILSISAAALIYQIIAGLERSLQLATLVALVAASVMLILNKSEKAQPILPFIALAAMSELSFVYIFSEQKLFSIFMLYVLLIIMSSYLKRSYLVMAYGVGMLGLTAGASHWKQLNTVSGQELFVLFSYYTACAIILFYYERLSNGKYGQYDSSAETQDTDELIERLEQRIAELEAENKRLQELKRLQDEYLAITSHELRTPLNGVVGITDSMLDGNPFNLPAQVSSQLEFVLNCGKRLSNLINDILDQAKMRNGELHLRTTPVALEKEIAQAIGLFKPLLNRRPVQLIDELTGKGPLNGHWPMVSADRDRLQQILGNLLMNAIKFTESGSIRIYASESKGMIEICIQDTGIGIPPEKCGLIFNSYEQADVSIARRYGGTGLGLSITQRLVEHHGGTILAESVQGEWTRIRFTLPMAKMSGQEEAV